MSKVRKQITIDKDVDTSIEQRARQGWNFSNWVNNNYRNAFMGAKAVEMDIQQLKTQLEQLEFEKRKLALEEEIVQEKQHKLLDEFVHKEVCIEEAVYVKKLSEDMEEFYKNSERYANEYTNLFGMFRGKPITNKMLLAKINHVKKMLEPTTERKGP